MQKHSDFQKRKSCSRDTYFKGILRPHSDSYPYDDPFPYSFLAAVDAQETKEDDDDASAKDGGGGVDKNCREKLSGCFDAIADARQKGCS